MYVLVCVHACRCEYTDDSWVRSIMNEVLNVFLSRVSTNGGAVGKYSPHTHTHSHLPQHLQITHTHRPCLPSSPPTRIPLLPSEGTISRPALSTHSPGSRLAPAHLAPSCSRPFSPVPPNCPVVGGPEIGLFYPETEGLWWGWAKGMKPG